MEIKSKEWIKLSLIEQLSHVGAEVHRASNWEQKGDMKSRNNARERAIDLVDSILAGTNLSHRTREIARLRETICAYYAGKSEGNDSLSMLDNYFLSLAIYARNQKAKPCS